MNKLTERDRRRLAAEAEVDPRTVDRAFGGLYVRPLVRGRIEGAAHRLRMELPPDPAGQAEPIR